MLDEVLAAITPVDANAAAAASRRQAELAKPPGSLGRLEQVGAQLAAIAGRCPPPVPKRPVTVVAAADHGVHARGVSDWPQTITSAMVRTVAAEKAAVNAISRTVGATVAVVDVGTVETGPLPHGVIDERIRAGTADVVHEPALSVDECLDAITAGVRVTNQLLTAGADLLVVGDLGIGNTTTSSCLISAFTGARPELVTGAGANHGTARIHRKVEVITAALVRHGRGREPLPVLASLGGLEHAALVGVILAGAAARIPVILDGVITNAAALAAVALAPLAQGYLIAGHTSLEPGAAVALQHLRLPPLLDLQLHLGEGTGALLAVPLVQTAARVLSEVVTLDEIVAG